MPGAKRIPGAERHGQCRGGRLLDTAWAPANLLNVARSDNIVALCDCDDSAAARAATARRGIPEKFPKAVYYKDFRQMLEKQKDIDAVVVATPDDNHAMVALTAMQLGKHVLRPEAVDALDCRSPGARRGRAQGQGRHPDGQPGALRRGAAPDAGVVERRRDPAGARGALLDQPSDLAAGHARPTDTPAVPEELDWDLWIGPAPMRPYDPADHPFGWRAWQDFGAGAMGDMACHVMDAALHGPEAGRAESVVAMLAYNFMPPDPSRPGTARA